MKRAFDFLAALIGLTLLLPLLATVALAIWVEDRHSPFFFGKRVARGGRQEFRQPRPATAASRASVRSSAAPSSTNCRSCGTS
jgi:lipopolysaccharide/colanic/teichoic acid biosynthesis glycosyltransferase